MVQESLWYSLISLAASGAALGLAVYVLRRIPNRRAGDLFVLAMTFFFSAGLLAFLTRTSPADPNALLLARVFYFAHTLTVGYTMAFVGAYFYGFQFFRRRAVSVGMQIVLLFAAIFVASQVNEVRRTDPVGTFVETRGAVTALAAAAAAFSVSGLATLVRTAVATRDPLVRRQALLMTAGLGFHIGAAVWYAVTRLAPAAPGAYPPPLLALTALLMVGTFTLAIERYQMFSVTAQEEEREATAELVELQPSRSYLLKEKSRHRAFTVLADAVRHGRPGLCVTRANPHTVRQEYGLERTPILWLTTAMGHNQVPPTDLRLLQRLLGEGVKDLPKPVVLLEGVEYLLVYNPFDRVLRLLHGARDTVEAAGGTLLLSLDTGVLEEDPARLVESEFSVLEARPAGGYSVEDVFVIDQAGLLLVHNTRRLLATADHDQLAAMLTAIEAFARDAIREGGELQHLDLGGKKVVLDRGRKLLVAVVYSGPEPPWLRREIHSFITRAERRFGDLLDSWAGDTSRLGPLKVLTNRLLA